MGIWIEFRCELRVVSAGETEGKRCWSQDNTGPMGLSSDDQKSVLWNLRELGREAKAAGWRRTKEGWICPYCASTNGSATVSPIAMAGAAVST